jgi:RimJ/RimL family protein N-acetyltransferase
MSTVTFVRPTRDDAALMLGWRSQPRVTEFMKTDFTQPLEAQVAWLEACETRTDYEHWLACYKGEKFGFINISWHDGRREADWGYYIGEESRTLLGATVPAYFYNHVFFELGLSAVYANVAEPNVGVLRLHRSHGYEDVGRIEKGIDKPALTCDLLRLRLAAETWAENFKPLHRYRAPWEPRRTPALAAGA